MTGPTYPGPTHPGPTHPPKADDGMECSYGIGEPHEYSCPALPTLADWVSDLERLGTQLHIVHGRVLDPASLPTGTAFHQYDLRRESAGFHLEAFLRDVAGLDRLGPAIKTSRLLPGEEPTPGSAAALDGAARESTGAVVAPGAGTSSDPSPASAPPVAPGRGVGPGYIGPTDGQDAFAKAIVDVMAREAARRRG